MSAKLQRAIRTLHREIEKLDPKARTAIEAQLKIIQAELSSALGGLVADPVWITTVPPAAKKK